MPAGGEAELDLPAPPFLLPANRSSLSAHHRASARAKSMCVAVSLFGLPRTLSHAKLGEAYREQLLTPLMPCVDVFLGFGFGAQKGGMQDGASCKSCLAGLPTGGGLPIGGSSKHPTDAALWAPFTSVLKALRPMSAQHTWSYKRGAKQALCVRAMAQVEASVEPEYPNTRTRALALTQRWRRSKLRSALGTTGPS